jgi:hypothetical protein
MPAKDTKGPSREDGDNDRRDTTDHLEVAALNAAEQGLDDKPEQPPDLPEGEWLDEFESGGGNKYSKYDGYK